MATARSTQMQKQNEISIINNLLDGLSKNEKLNKNRIRSFLAGNEASIVAELIHTLEKASAVTNLKLLLDLLLLSNDEAVFKKYSLKKIGAVYKKLTKLFPDDIDINLSYYDYLYNIMDREKEANEFYEQFILKVNSKLKKYRL